MPPKVRSSKGIPKSKKAPKGISKANAKKVKILEMCGGFKKVKILGQGSYGKVYEVTKPELSSNIAAKITKPESIGGIKFISWSDIKEIDLLSRLNHPNLINSISPTYLSNTQVCSFMDLASGDLEDQMRKNRSLEESVSVIGQLWSGLDYLHTNFVIHCDIKPQNILVIIGENGKIIPKIADFGLSVVTTASKKVLFTQPIVTIPWRAPELLVAESFERFIRKINPMTNQIPPYYFGFEIDVYSMGWVAMEYLTGLGPSYANMNDGDQYLQNLLNIGIYPQFKFQSLSYQGHPFPIKIPETISNFDFSKINFNGLTPEMIPYFQVLVKCIIQGPEQRPSSKQMAAFFSGSVTENPTPPQIVDVHYTPFYSEKCRKECIKLLLERIIKIKDKFGTNYPGVLLGAIDLMDRVFSTCVDSKEQVLPTIACVLGIISNVFSWDENPFELELLNILDEKSIIGKSNQKALLQKTYFNRYPEIIRALGGKLFRRTMDYDSKISTLEALDIFYKELSPSGI